MRPQGLRCFLLPGQQQSQRRRAYLLLHLLRVDVVHGRLLTTWSFTPSSTAPLVTSFPSRVVLRDLGSTFCLSGRARPLWRAFTAGLWRWPVPLPSVRALLRCQVPHPFRPPSQRSRQVQSSRCVRSPGVQLVSRVRDLSTSPPRAQRSPLLHFIQHGAGLGFSGQGAPAGHPQKLASNRSPSLPLSRLPLTRATTSHPLHLQHSLRSSTRAPGPPLKTLPSRSAPDTLLQPPITRSAFPLSLRPLLQSTSSRTLSFYGATAAFDPSPRCLPSPIGSSPVPPAIRRAGRPFTAPAAHSSGRLRLLTRPHSDLGQRPPGSGTRQPSTADRSAVPTPSRESSGAIKEGFLGAKGYGLCVLEWRVGVYVISQKVVEVVKKDVNIRCEIGWAIEEEEL
ncbi:hypothetical protein NDU88_001683 [Pleurodeles waltl]|uniref:Uncharacterized protein n=1 Tax=Pleurodeles waltl TaxID=8319 RepID=A0AAV7U945_PLEWA|nr:hypothetical protein NDU88_001683 [Pleurodeles waltl]